jgi:hypothetical protein
VDKTLTCVVPPKSISKSAGAKGPAKDVLASQPVVPKNARKDGERRKDDDDSQAYRFTNMVLTPKAINTRAASLPDTPVDDLSWRPLQFRRLDNLYRPLDLPLPPMLAPPDPAELEAAYTRDLQRWYRENIDRPGSYPSMVNDEATWTNYMSSPAMKAFYLPAFAYTRHGRLAWSRVGSPSHYTVHVLIRDMHRLESLSQELRPALSTSSSRIAPGLVGFALPPEPGDDQPAIRVT